MLFLDGNRREYGGYLPLETFEKDDWFSGCGEENVLRTNSAKAAMYFALKQSGARKVCAPHYMCASVKNMLREAGVETEYYFLDDDLLPKLSHMEREPGTAALLVNYFGILEERVRKFMERCPLVLLDHSHGFFARPVLREGVYNIYSCRKFFGVPDGGYLIGPGVRRDLEPDLVSGQFSYLVVSFEQGTNAAYEQKKASDRYFMGNYKGMSRMSRRLLSAVDYEEVRQKRIENFESLHSLLREDNLLAIPDPRTPAYVYPFLPKAGRDLKERLVAERIFVSTLWRELISPQFEGTLEYRISRDAVFLPIDQRYGRKDMEYIAGRAKCLMND